jgi:LmbE family N-acetylglucosaminyl deacetylase
MLNSFKNVLVLAAHTDDGEIGAGGLICKLVENSANVHYAAFSICEESVPKEFPNDILATEVMHATAKLGIPQNNVHVSRLKVREFSYHRQALLDRMITLRKLINPDLVIMPSKFDFHQDHEVIYNEGIRAFRYSTMIGYEMPWNNISFKANLIVELEKKHVEKKISAFEQYKSQSFRPYGREEIEMLAISRGWQIQKRYAEAFNIVRWLCLSK